MIALHNTGLKAWKKDRVTKRNNDQITAEKKIEEIRDSRLARINNNEENIEILL